MRRLITTLSLAILTSALSLASTNEPDSMYVHFTSSLGVDSIVSHAIDAIDSIVYYAPVEIGDFAHGGIVYYILKSTDIGYDENVQHGLVCAVSDQDGGSGVMWSKGGAFDDIDADSMAIGYGQANTTALFTKYNNGNYAASLCHTLDLGGYTDWFLPSCYELIAMYDSKDAINAAALSHDGSAFVLERYWSSTEHAPAFGIGHDFSVNSGGGCIKVDYYRVRAVRAF